MAEFVHCLKPIHERHVLADGNVKSTIGIIAMATDFSKDSYALWTMEHPFAILGKI